MVHLPLCRGESRGEQKKWAGHRQVWTSTVTYDPWPETQPNLKSNKIIRTSYFQSWEKNYGLNKPQKRNSQECETEKNRGRAVLWRGRRMHALFSRLSALIANVELAVCSACQAACVVAGIVFRGCVFAVNGSRTSRWSWS